MDLKILEERKNPLLHRTEYRFELTHPTAATPPRKDVRTELAKLVKVPTERLVVEAMHAKFGRATTEGVAAAYESKEALEVIVREHILVRNGLKEKAAAEPPAAAAAEAAPAKPASPPAKADAAKEPAPKKE
ncbi:MAG TPA: 30S ribosomal protein S24e [Thermoplasmata archaeon]|nr:30S ribosomal protein S24e [Thermoplasmata archaeon]